MPARLLLDGDLSASAKLLWLTGRLCDDWSPAGLQRISGLARGTVLKGLTELRAAGWFAHTTRGERKVVVPGDLLTDVRLGVNARLLYGVLQLAEGPCSYAGLSSLACMSPNTVKRAVGELVRAGWLQVSQPHKYAPVRFVLSHPQAARDQAELEAARQRLEEAPYLGEALMREFLSLLIDSDAFEENASPGFLVNPWTDERMQFDRFYPPDVAFEFNGPQHYGPTGRFSGESAARQRGRDYMKMGICVERGIRLVIIHPEDLTLKAMSAKLGDHLPRRELTGHEPLIRFLEAVSRRYRRAAKGW